MNLHTLPESTIHQDPRQPEFVQNPYALYRRMHQLGGAVYWHDYGFWCLADHASINAVLRDRRFARLPPVGHEAAPWPDHLADFAAAEQFSLLSLEPPEHTRLRKRVNRAFVSRQVQRLAPMIAARANACIDTFATREQTDLLDSYASPIPVALIAQLLGVPEQAGAQLVAWSHAMVRVYTLTQTHAEEVAANRAASEFRDFLLQHLEIKRRHPASDLLTQLLQHEGDDADALSDEELVSIAILLLNAGHEATVHQLGNAVKTLLEHYPRGSARQELLALLSDDDTCDALVNECLRHDAPLHLFTRHAQQDVRLENGVQLATGDTIGLLLAAGNRCPLRFSEPERFDPLRSDPGHLSLGAGIHFCIGAPLARLELRIALQVLFDRLPELEIAGAVNYRDAYHFHGLQQLPVRWLP